jgi:hypothetical protein
MIDLNGITNGAPAMVGGVVWRSMETTAVAFGADLVPIVVVAVSSYLSMRNLR